MALLRPTTLCGALEHVNASMHMKEMDVQYWKENRFITQFTLAEYKKTAILHWLFLWSSEGGIIVGLLVETPTNARCSRDSR